MVLMNPRGDKGTNKTVRMTVWGLRQTLIMDWQGHISKLDQKLLPGLLFACLIMEPSISFICDNS